MLTTHKKALEAAMGRNRELTRRLDEKDADAAEWLKWRNAEIAEVHNDLARVHRLYQEKSEEARRLSRRIGELALEIGTLKRARDGWEADALKYANDAGYWRDRYKGLGEKAEPGEHEAQQRQHCDW